MMVWDPRDNDPHHLQDYAEASKERARKRGLAAMPTILLVVLLPLLLLARLAIWGWRRVRPARS